MQHVVYKTLFLIALASARRISVLHALLVEPPFIIENPLSFNLAWIRFFYQTQAPRKPWVRALSSGALFLTPPRSMSGFYNEYVPQGKSRFIFTTRARIRHCLSIIIQAKAARPISKATLGYFWWSPFENSILFSIGKKKLSVPAPTKLSVPAPTQGVATMWAEFARVPSKQICWATTWKASCSFARHYPLDLATSKKSTIANFTTRMSTVVTRGCL